MNIFDILGPVMVGPVQFPYGGSGQNRVCYKDNAGRRAVNAMISLSGSFCSDRERTRNRPGAYRRASWYEAG